MRLKLNALKRIELEETATHDFRREQARQQEIDKLITNFKEEASSLLASFNEQADEMHETATSMNAMAETAHKESAEAKDNSFESTFKPPALSLIKGPPVRRTHPTASLLLPHQRKKLAMLSTSSKTSQSKPICWL